MIPALTNHLWQSTLFAVAAGLLTLALRQNRARVRHAMWLVASLKFLVPFSLLMSVGPLMWTPRANASEPVVASDVSAAVLQFTEPFADAPASTPLVATDTSAARYVLPAAMLAWGGGCLALIVMRLRAWRRVRAAVRASVPLTVVTAGLQPCGSRGGLKPTACELPLRAAPGLLEPGVVGLWRPILLVPAGIESRLTSPQLQAVLAHEEHHVARRDNLTSAIHMLVETVFWFHPLVWWISARLVDERERACDEYVLRVCGEPQAYAEGIVNVCRLYVESPLACVSGVSGFVSPKWIGGGGSAVKRRVEAILAGAVSRELGVAKRIALTIAGVAAIAIPIGVGAMTAPASPVVSSGRNFGVASQAFEVVSVKPCAAPAPDLGARAGGAGQGLPSPGRVHLDCVPLVGGNGLIKSAYGNYADGTLNAYWTSLRIEGAPAWASAERFTIEAKADTAIGLPMMRGPMMQKLLEDRFHLKVHRETRDIPVYELTIARGGPKLKPFDGRCKPVDFTKGGLPAQLEADGACGIVMHDTVVEAPGQTIEDFIRFALVLMDRPVIDKTGLTGRFDIHLDLPKDANTLPSDVTSQIAMAVQQQLGLKVTATKGRGEYLVVDHVERPVPDTDIRPSASVPPSPSASFGRGSGGTSQTFEVASVKPCEQEQPAVPGGRSGGGNGSFSPGRAHLNCFVVKNLISNAYINIRAANRGDSGKDPGDPLHNWPGLLGQDLSGAPQQIRGGPSWVYSDKYTIEATAPGLDPTEARNPDRATMLGPMLRALLEDRFKLKLHKEIEQAPMWALAVAKGGLKIKPMAEDGCTKGWADGPITLSKAASLGVKPTCGTVNGGPNGPNWRYEHGGQTLAVIASMLSSDLGAKVFDRTGITDVFNITWEYGPDENTPGAVRMMERFAPGATPTAANVFTALEQQLGLKLERTTGPRGYLVIDHIERPTPNSPSRKAP